MKQFAIAAYVENKYGVLTRVSSLFMRKGFNIDALTVSETDDPAYSRITITSKGEENEQQQLIHQLNKLYNVKSVKGLDREKTVERELMLIKVRNTPENRNELMAASEIYRGKIIDYTPETICVEVTGEPAKINAFVQVLKPLGITETCRTGVVALERGGNIMDCKH